MSTQQQNILFEGDILNALNAIPDNSVDCIPTSPPYWGLRDYKLPKTHWPKVIIFVPLSAVSIASCSAAALAYGRGFFYPLAQTLSSS